MAFEFYLNQNDTGPSMAATLKDESDAAYDLTGATVLFKGIKPDGTAFSKSVTLTDDAAGIVRVDWVAADTTQAGVVEFQWEITFPTTIIETVPNDRFYKIYIHPEVG
jgi:hypothetical protein